jgi:hypothetical protein
MRKEVKIMKTIPTNRVESEIDNTLELTSICRGDWCRALECEVDSLREEWNRMTGGPTLTYGVPRDEVTRKIRAAYRNLGPDIHI